MKFRRCGGITGLAVLLATTGCSLLRRSEASRKPAAADAAPEAGQTVRESPAPAILPETRMSAGKLMEREGNLDGAVEQYRKALEADPHNVEAYARMGIVLNRLQQFEPAVRAFLGAIELAPQKAYLYNNLGFCYVLQGRFTEAEQALRRALELRPNYARARMNLGALLAHTNRTKEAVAEFEKVVSADWAYYNLGLILAANQRVNGADQAFRRALALNPNLREAAIQIAQLQRRRGEGARPNEPLVAEMRELGAAGSAPQAMSIPPSTQPTGCDESVAEPVMDVGIPPAQAERSP